jgi:hypothetical protein
MILAGILPALQHLFRATNIKDDSSSSSRQG